MRPSELATSDAERGGAGPAASEAAPHSGKAGRLVNVPCPRCGADDPEFRYRLVQSSIVRCRRCAMSYVNPRVASAQLQRKLQSWAEQDVVDRERLESAFAPASLAYYGRFVGYVQRHASGPGRRLLDIGCSTGAFMTVAREAGWQVQGLEVGEASARYAREVLGLDVRCASLYEFDAPEGSYDAVSMIEVIEHLEQPREALLRVRRLLAPGGVLLLTTPNFDSLYRRLFGARWWVINCEDEHIVLFNLATLAGMLQECGFEVLFRHVRGVDVTGMARELRGLLRGGRDSSNAAGAALAGYYQSRTAKARIKQVLRRIGVLDMTRSLMHALDRTYAWRASPTYAWGEQLVVVARRSREED